MDLNQHEEDAIKVCNTKLRNTLSALAYRDEIIRDLLEVAEAMRDWIDAVPPDTPLPTMPGFDRDWADSVIEEAGIYK